VSLYIRGDFHVCPNPLSLDPYTKCEYDCRFCFVKEMEYTVLKKRAEKGLAPIDLECLRRKLTQAFDSKNDTVDPVVMALREGLTVIIGRKCEALCPLEFKVGRTLDCLELLNLYGVPTVIETKGVIPDDCFHQYSKVLEELKAGFNISLTPGPDSLVEKLEPGTPKYSERWEFAARLLDAGFWVGIKSEPIIPGVNDDEKWIHEFADIASKIGVKHVNFGEYRIHNARIAAERMKSAGFNLAKIIRLKREGWLGKSRKIFDILKSYGLKVTTPDWVNFGDINDCESCCGFDGVFPVHCFTFQRAVKLLTVRDKVYFDDLLIHNIFGSKYAEKFREIWNGKRGYYTLADVPGVELIGYDDEGNAIYGKNRNLTNIFG